MPCRLCGNERPLIDAHVIPKSFHRIDPTERHPSRMLTNVPGMYARKLRKGVYDSKIVCEECERRFSPWDDYAAELFLEKWADFQPIVEGGSHVGFTIPAFDYPKLKLFFISLLWRAHVAGHQMFYQVDVGPHEELLKQSILGSDPKDPNHYGIVLQAFDTSAVGMLNPHPERFFGVRFYRFYLAHVIAYVKVDQRPIPAVFQSGMLSPGSALVLAAKNFATSPERTIMRNLVVSDHARAARR